MSASDRPRSTLPDVLYLGHRGLRELGENEPGFSLQRDAMRELGLLTDDGVVEGHQIKTAIYPDGRVFADLQIDVGP